MLDRPSSRRRRHIYNELLARDGPWCKYCGVLFEFASKKRLMTIDHRVPLCNGGTNDIENLVLACNRCNNMKSDYPEDDPLFQEYLQERINTISGHLNTHKHESILFTRQGNWSCICGAHGTKKDDPKQVECKLLRYAAFYRPAS